MSVYNVRLIEYAEGRQVRFYKKLVGDMGEEKEKKKNEKKNCREKDPWTGQTEEQMAHSKKTSASRTKQKVYEICRANVWDWFVTLTFDRKKIDSSDYELLTQKVSAWLKFIKKTKCPNLKYMIVPELHKDGKHYHFHGLFADTGNLTFTDSGITCEENAIYNLSDFKYGFSTATKVNDTNRVSSYVSKYITKDLIEVTKGKKRYWSSRNLDKAIVSEYLMTVAEKEELLLSLSDEILHMKTQEVPVIDQQIYYIELTK